MKKEKEEEQKTAKEYKCIMGSNGPIYYFNQGNYKCTCSTYPVVFIKYI